MAVKEKYNLYNVIPNMDSWLLPRENGMLLSDHQVKVLNKNGIDYKKYKTNKELLMAFNEFDMDDELEEIAREIDEKDYYSRLVN